MGPTGPIHRNKTHHHQTRLTSKLIHDMHLRTKTKKLRQKDEIQTQRYCT